MRVYEIISSFLKVNDETFRFGFYYALLERRAVPTKSSSVSIASIFFVIDSARSPVSLPSEST